MIKISITNDNITITGHANFANYGKDIVCASVSSIVITTVNALVRFDEECIKYIEKDGLIDLTILKKGHHVEVLIENMISLLHELEQQYPKNIKIK